MPTIASFMTAAPYSVQRNHPLAIAETLMREKHIRHLPVLEGTRLVGIVSDRDLRRALESPDAERKVIGSVMKPDPYMVPPTAPMEEVARTMAERRYGSVVVVDGDRVRGIFTTVDALRLLERLVKNLPEPT